MELMLWKSNSIYNRDINYIYNVPEIALVLVLWKYHSENSQYSSFNIEVALCDSAYNRDQSVHWGYFLAKGVHKLFLED